MIVRHLFVGLLGMALAFEPADATNRKPVVYGNIGQQWQISTGDTLQLPAPTTGSASVNLPHGTAPTSPSNGDCWTTTGGLYCRINGSTVGPMGASSSGPSAANPSATASDTAVNGSAATFMRSDAAPAVQKASSSQFGIVKVDGTTVTASGGVISAIGGGGTGTFHGTRATKSAAQAMVASTLTLVTWNTEDFDTDALHDTSTNTDRITIPSGFNNYYVQATANLQSNFASAGTFEVEIHQYSSGGTLKNVWAERAYGQGWRASGVTTGPVKVATGDYFNAWYYSFTTGGNIETSSSFSLAVIGS